MDLHSNVSSNRHLLTSATDSVDDKQASLCFKRSGRRLWQSPTKMMLARAQLLAHSRDCSWGHPTILTSRSQPVLGYHDHAMTILGSAVTVRTQWPPVYFYAMHRTILFLHASYIYDFSHGSDAVACGKHDQVRLVYGLRSCFSVDAASERHARACHTAFPNFLVHPSH